MAATDPAGRTKKSHNVKQLFLYSQPLFPWDDFAISTLSQNRNQSALSQNYRYFNSFF